jgi:hypothetical protein
MVTYSAPGLAEALKVDLIFAYTCPVFQQDIVLGQKQ